MQYVNDPYSYLLSGLTSCNLKGPHSFDLEFVMTLETVDVTNVLVCCDGEWASADECGNLSAEGA